MLKRDRGLLLAVIAALLVVAALGLGVAMARRSGVSPHADASERLFISSVLYRLMARYPTKAQAMQAGYIAITGIEKDGTAVYFNPRLMRVDRFHPNFLWYDKHGRLAGLDYEFPRSLYPKPPAQIFAVSATRWTSVNEHIHFNYRTGEGLLRMGMSHPRPNLRHNPITAPELRADRLLPANSQLVWAYDHPASWDLGFWLVPNPNGAFASRNPLVQK